MQISLYRLSRAKKLENAILASIVLFLFNVVSPVHDSLLLFILNDIIVFFTTVFIYGYIQQFIHSKTDSPLSLILNAGILAALIFFIISISNSVFEIPAADGSSSNFFNSIFYILLIFLFIGILAYIFAAFNELFYLRQKKDPSIYFNTMLVFFALAFFSNVLIKIDPSMDYPKNAFFVVSIILISINSLRVAWIAFLVKKQKIYLLIISTVLAVLFGFNFALLSESNVVKQMIFNFSPGLLTAFSLVMLYGTIYCGVIFFTTLFHLPTAEAFDRKAEEVTSLMDLTKLITQVFDFKELADTITTTTIKVCNSNTSWLVTTNENGYDISSVNNIGFVEADKVTKMLLEEYNYEIAEVITLHRGAIKFSLRNDIDTLNFKSIAIAPLKVYNNISGYLFTARKDDYNFDSDEIKAIEAFADYAAVALENAKLIKESIIKERLEKELDVAREIQRKILPAQTPDYPKLEVSALFIPAFEVGGDYYDFFELGGNKLGFVVADVSGKGISAAFIMAEIKGIFNSLSKMIVNPKELLIKANDILKNSLDRKNFVTAVYGILDTETGRLSFARVGHPPAIHCSGGVVNRLQPPGIGLGLDYSPNFENSIKEMEIKLKNNDIIAFYSDGIPEAKNSKMEDFGYERFDSLLLSNCGKSLSEMTNIIMKEISLFSKDNSQHDDITLVLFKWVSNK